MSLKNYTIFTIITFLFLTFFKIVNLQPISSQKNIIQQPKLPYHILQVYGNTTFGYYYVDLFFGSPPQQQSVIIDTGSSMLTVPCTKCTSCSKTHLDSYFDLSKSKTSKFLTCASQSIFCKPRCTKGDIDGTQSCTFTVSYAQGSSLQGIYLQDYVQFQSNTAGQQVKIDFGCTTKQTNLFLKQEANGIFGLAPQRTPIFEKIFNHHSPKTHELLQIGLCLRKNGGYMSVGGAEQKFHRKPSIKTTFTEGTNLYSIQKVGDVKLGDKVFHKSGEKVGSYGVFIDSGSTFTYLPSNQYQIFIKLLDQKCQKSQNCHITKSNSPRCYKMQPNKQEKFSIRQLQQSIKQTFPPIVMQIAGIDLQWSPTEYFILRDLVSKDICLGIQKFDRFLLGANWMINKDIIFNNKDKTVQIFPQSHCEFQKPVNQQYLQVKLIKQQNSVQKQKDNKQNQTTMSQLFDKVSGNPPLDLLKQNAKKQIWMIIFVCGCVILAIFMLVIVFCSKDRKKGSSILKNEDEQDDEIIGEKYDKKLSNSQKNKKQQKFDKIQEMNQAINQKGNNSQNINCNNRKLIQNEQISNKIFVADEDL